MCVALCVCDPVCVSVCACICTVKTWPGGTCSIWLYELLTLFTYLLMTGEPMGLDAKVQRLLPQFMPPSSGVRHISTQRMSLSRCQWKCMARELLDDTWKWDTHIGAGGVRLLPSAGWHSRVFVLCFLLVSAVSHSYGYGLLDAGAIVSLAKTWTNVRPQRKCVITILTEPRWVLCSCTQIKGAYTH